MLLRVRVLLLTHILIQQYSFIYIKKAKLREGAVWLAERMLWLELQRSVFKGKKLSATRNKNRLHEVREGGTDAARHKVGGARKYERWGQQIAC